MTSPKGKARFFALALLTAACVTVSWMCSQTRFFQTIELKTLDFRFRILGKQDSASPDIVLAEIDDNSIKHLEPAFGRWPWSREVHGLFLKFMKEAGARLVIYDVLFTEENLSDPDGDAYFATETAECGRVVHAVFLGDQDNTAVENPEDSAVLDRFSQPGEAPGLPFIQIDLPYPALAEAAKAIGHAANALDSDGPFRHYLVVGWANGRVFPSLALAGYLALQSKEPTDFRIADQSVTAASSRIPLNSDWRLPIWFNGGPGTYPSFSYSHVVYSQLQIDAGESPGLDPAEFKDKIVFVGVNATGLYDMFTTPYSGSAEESNEGGEGGQLGKMPGVEVHANVLDDLLHDRYLVDPPGWLNWFLGLLVTLLVVVFVFYLRLAFAGPVSMVLLGGYLWLAQYLFEAHHYRLPVAAAILCWSLALGSGLAYQYWVEGAEKRQVKGIFSRYVSRDVFDQLMNDPEAARLGGQRMTVTVLFSDIRGFTTLSESRSPEEIVTLLNEYFSAMVDIVFAHQGTVDKFVGDMIMALFNAPLSDPMHADHAVQCGIAMQKRLAELNVGWAERGLPPLASGVGINTGEMIAGNVGAESIRSYTVIGDNVNLGSRLESLCKEYKCRMIISEFTRSRLQGSYDFEELGDVLVKGKTKPVKIVGVRIDGKL